jgi:hypothetical protein
MEIDETKYEVFKEMDPFTGEFSYVAQRFNRILNSFFGRRFKQEDAARLYCDGMNKKIAEDVAAGEIPREGDSGKLSE